MLNFPTLFLILTRPHLLRIVHKYVNVAVGIHVVVFPVSRPVVEEELVSVLLPRDWPVNVQRGLERVAAAMVVVERGGDADACMGRDWKHMDFCFPIHLFAKNDCKELRLDQALTNDYL